MLFIKNYNIIGDGRKIHNFFYYKLKIREDYHEFKGKMA